MQFSPASHHFLPRRSAACSQTFSSLNVRDHVSHPHRTTGKIIVSINFFERRWEGKRFGTEW
jgi:hypothetical protein